MYKQAEETCFWYDSWEGGGGGGARQQGFTRLFLQLLKVIQWLAVKHIMSSWWRKDAVSSTCVSSPYGPPTPLGCVCRNRGPLAHFACIFTNCRRDRKSHRSARRQRWMSRALHFSPSSLCEDCRNSHTDLWNKLFARTRRFSLRKKKEEEMKEHKEKHKPQLRRQLIVKMKKKTNVQKCVFV